MATQFLQNPRLNVDGFRVLLLQLFMIGVPFPNFHRRFNDEARTNARELRGATEIR